MSKIMSMQSRLGELSALENVLWRAFKRAETKYIPPALNLWAATSNFLRLRRRGYLRLYEFYPFYAAIATGAAVAAVLGHRWMFAVYIVALVPTFLFLSKYTKQFAFDKTSMLGLDRYGFGVPHLPLLVYGMTKILEDNAEPAKDVVPAPLTKENLASVIKLVKGGHEHGEVGYGFNDAAKKWLFGGVASALVFASTKANEVTPIADKLWQLGKNDPRISALALVVAACAVYFVYELIFSFANEKRRKRRYLLALNVMQESWAAPGTPEAEASACIAMQVTSEEAKG